jgi:hemoglobin
MATIPNELPPGLEVYGRSPEFSSANLPAKLQSAHSTKAGTWGLLRVIEGKLRYVLEAPQRDERTVTAGGTVVIEPEALHHVEFIEPGRFFIEFCRVPVPAR